MYAVLYILASADRDALRETDPTCMCSFSSHLIFHRGCFIISIMAILLIIIFFIVDISTKKWSSSRQTSHLFPVVSIVSSRMWAGRVHEIQYRSNLFTDDKYSASRGNVCFVNTLREENVS